MRTGKGFLLIQQLLDCRRLCVQKGLQRFIGQRALQLRQVLQGQLTAQRMVGPRQDIERLKRQATGR